MRSVGFLRPALDNPMTQPVFAPMALWVGPDVTVRPAGDPMVADTAPQTQLQPGEPQIGTGLIVGLSVASLISGAISGMVAGAVLGLIVGSVSDSCPND